MTTEALTVLPSSRAVSRSVGPLAWVILEDLALRAEAGPSGLTVETNVRELAGQLEVGKDAIAKAVGRLVDVGLVQVQALRRAGRYAGGAYVLNVEACRGAGMVVSPCAVGRSPGPVVPCPVDPDPVDGDVRDSTSTGTVRVSGVSGSSALWHPASGDSSSQSLFELSDQTRSALSQALTRSPDPSTSSDPPTLEPSR